MGIKDAIKLSPGDVVIARVDGQEIEAEIGGIDKVHSSSKLITFETDQGPIEHKSILRVAP